MSAVLDTHTVLWYLENSKELSAVARATIEDAIRDARDVHVSAISVIEAVYLVERKKIPATALHRLRDALSDRSIRIVHRPCGCLRRKRSRESSSQRRSRYA